MNPYLIIAAILVVLSAATGGYFKGRDDANSAWLVSQAQEAEKARKREQELQEASNEITRQWAAAQSRTQQQLDAALDQLRKRPERLPDAARTECKGSTGAELSGPDSGFLAREAARADGLRGALIACYQWADTITKGRADE